MEDFLYVFLSYLLLYKYAALFFIAFTAAFAIPFPSSTVLVAASALAAQGYFSPLLVLVVAIAGNIAGDTAGYLLSRHFGKSLLQRFRLDRLLHTQFYRQFTSTITIFPHSLIYFSRFLTSIGPIVNVLSGLSGVHVRTFFLFDILGEISYVLIYGVTGYFLGAQWENNISFLIKIGSTMGLLGLFNILLQVKLYGRRISRDFRN